MGSLKRMVLIRRMLEPDLGATLAIINEAARAYRGVIPADRWHEPYMSRKYAMRWTPRTRSISLPTSRQNQTTIDGATEVIRLDPARSPLTSSG